MHSYRYIDKDINVSDAAESSGIESSGTENSGEDDISGTRQISGQGDEEADGQDDQVMLPETGGPGTYRYTLSGLMLVILSAMMYGILKKWPERGIADENQRSRHS